MPPCLKAIARQGMGGKGEMLSDQKHRNMEKGYSSDVPVVYRSLVDQWEVDLVA